MDLYIPLDKKFGGSCGYRRPLSSDVRDQIKLKHCRWRTYLKTKKIEDFVYYKKIRNRVKSLLKQRDRQEETSIAKQVKLNPKKKFGSMLTVELRIKRGYPALNTNYTVLICWLRLTMGKHAH